MKSIVYFIGIFFCLVNFNGLSAQEKQQNYYLEKLNLDPAKAQKFEAINKQYEENVSALKIKSKSKKTLKKLKALEEIRDKEIEELLSEEKFEEYLQLRREKRNSLKTLIRKSNRQ